MINRDDIKLFILPKQLELTPEIVYLDKLYYYDPTDEMWYADDIDYKTPKTTLANEIDLILYSDYIDSFIQFYIL